jgi:hypothetical protein
MRRRGTGGTAAVIMPGTGKFAPFPSFVLLFGNINNFGFLMFLFHYFPQTSGWGMGSR